MGSTFFRYRVVCGFMSKISEREQQLRERREADWAAEDERRRRQAERGAWLEAGRPPRAVTKNASVTENPLPVTDIRATAVTDIPEGAVKRKRGRPRKDGALSTKERVARWRERQKAGGLSGESDKGEAAVLPPPHGGASNGVEE